MPKKKHTFIDLFAGIGGSTQLAKQKRLTKHSSYGKK